MSCVYAGPRLSNVTPAAFICKRHGKPCSELPMSISVGNTPISAITCKGCPDHKHVFGNGGWKYIRTYHLAQDAVNLIEKLPNDIGIVIGIPLSGMLPAIAIGLQLNVTVAQLLPNGTIDRIANGTRDRTASGKFLLIDDVLHTGRAMREAEKALVEKCYVKPESIVRACVYSTPPLAHTLDACSRIVDMPLLFEWHLFNSNLLHGSPYLGGGIMLDFDGVLCPDPPRFNEDTPDGRAAYLDWIANAPLSHPCRNASIKTIVSYRQEYTKAVTEQWLAVNGIRCENLVLHPNGKREWDSKHKSHVYAYSDCGLFIESEDWQAQQIHNDSGKPVLSLEKGVVYR